MEHEKKIIFSATQPSGRITLCNYLGMDFGSYFGDYRPPVKKDVFKGNY